MRRFPRLRNEGRKAIMAALDEHFVRLMRNWAMSDSRGGSYAMTSAYSGMQPDSGYAEASVPILNGEAEDVEAALVFVPIGFRMPVRVFWAFEGLGLPALARRCAMNYRTYKDRVMRGHVMLRAELARQRELRERVRAESLERLTRVRM